MPREDGAQREEFLHHNMTLIGGISGIYAITIRGGNFGAAQTANLIGLILDVSSLDIFDFCLRILVLAVYSVSLVAAHLITLYYPNHKRIICLIIESLCGLLAGSFPAEANPLLALCPIFVLSAFQWQIFTEQKHYNSSTLFSTNNLKQALMSWVNYRMYKESGQRQKSYFFLRTLVTFHLGILIGLAATNLWDEKGIWLIFVPMINALLYEIKQGRW